ncbi:competence protein ComEC [Marinobacterium halophilum]|uniref:Competence protein ComEC n=1 Tax=Marinobacterium halophilum TaxID=267374 RepID=A0A2P8F0A9_9GAMM|nr:DNA internalization-related competence protein ComEC/Rec2 [Marinobacterium halophilum]PSL15147.1 competence protein ComEC [Marinobacterium halophilum]
MIAYLFGIVCVALLPDLYWAGWCLLILLSGALYKRIRKPLLLCAVGVLLATVYGGWQLSYRFTLPPQDVNMEAEIVTLPHLQDGRYRLLLKPLVVDSDQPQLQRLRLLRVSYYGTDHDFAEGDRLRVVVRVSPPRGLSNPAAFDLERFYLSRGIDARGYIKQVLSRVPAQGELRYLRQSLADYLQSSFEPVAAATLRALLLGDRSQLTGEQWDVLRMTGTAHLFVVSGLHVAVVAAMGWCVGRGLMLPGLLLGFSARWVRFVPVLCALAIAGAYAGLSGWGVPVQRAWLMLAIFVLGGWFLQPLTGWQRWRVALVVVISLQPLAVLEAGTWLSFGAVALILWLFQVRDDGPAARLPVHVWLRLQGVLFFGMLPLMAASFNQMSLVSVPVNLIAVPVVTLLVWSLPLLLVSSLFSPLVAQVLESGIGLLWQLLSWCAEVPGLYVEVAAPSTITLMLASVAIALLLLPMPMLYRMLVLPLLIPLLSVRGPVPESGDFNAWMFDVGQGQAVLIETAEGAVLYDTGPGYSSGGSAFAFAVEPWLRARGIKRLEYLVLSHGDADHSGGYPAVIDTLAIGRVYAGEPEQAPGAIQCRAQRWHLGGVAFGFLPVFDVTAEPTANNRSCVLHVVNDNCSLLLTGDLDVSGEYRLLSGGFQEPLTWLVAGHHGSRDSTTAAILDLLQPAQVLISAGRYNRFGHPHEQVLARLSHRQIPWVLTAETGAVEMVADAGQCRINRYREQEKRYWTAG